jgi:Zn-dependent peptidase ImmA (M78 family)
MPAGMVRREWQMHGGIWQRRMQTIAQRFTVSKGAIGVRLVQLGLLTSVSGAKDDWPFKRRI